MDVRRRLAELRWPRQQSRALVVIPLALIVVISVVDVLAPSEVHLGPLLVAAPAITASFAGPRTTAAVGALAVLAQSIVAATRTTLLDLNHSVQIASLAVISALVTLGAHLREQHEKKMTQLRSVAEAAQTVVLRPLPHRMGPLRIASVYLAAEAEAQIGGDLYAAVRTAKGTRFLVGDVRGKGLAAISDASLLLGAFRAAAYRQPDLPALVTHLEEAVFRDGQDPGAPSAEDDPSEEETRESFITAVLLDIPDREPTIQLVDCGHPPPLVLRAGRVLSLDVGQPAPPLGLSGLLGADPVVETFAFEPGDIALLYTDGVIEARDRSGAFYPLAERIASWPPSDPQTLLRRLCGDLVAHAGGRLGDDAAMVAVERLPAEPERQAATRS
ncbi:serine phosphatase RsbU (regulator of sigma subunit) [Kitasatospora gansuensis]|uniref:Serine phosphatase RsbU (Regulator of sigma subunit) n=1 Tax=Kitasatospora gansuensis TaxID=258050 RepID=A0A7W7S7C9_9ACTN|nr:PP2C family protein-serine/threonine phosphatase [Kitasatospora gansuensis]MBB4945245.1 serine phosphatase RsbU (regulator of sigma subunit) [Kitasatospora gansuensis]